MGFISAIWSAANIWSKAGVILVILGAVGGGLYFVYDRIDQAGYNRAMAEVAAQKAKDQKTAAAKIKEVDDKNEAIKQSLRAEKGYNAPVSPLVASALARMPKRSASGR